MESTRNTVYTEESSRTAISKSYLNLGDKDDSSSSPNMYESEKVMNLKLNKFEKKGFMSKTTENVFSRNKRSIQEESYT